MTNKTCLAMGYGLLAIGFLTGCAGKQVKIDPGNPVYQPKSGFEKNYGFFITLDERKIGYSLEKYPKLSESVRPFDEIDTLDEFRKFEKFFWEIRDTDINTPQNEFKEMIDGRLKNIENEIFASDIDIPGTRFSRNGGLKGDMAHVYLFYGEPHFKASFSGDYMELMVWYYFDPYYDRPLFRFLFYRRFDRLTLFKHYGFIDLESVLKEISYRWLSSQEDFQFAWEELVQNDELVAGNDRNGMEFAFRAALSEFSAYSSDIVIENGDEKKFGALDPPEPAALTAERYKPTILGQPETEGRSFIESSDYSLIPAKVVIGKDLKTGRPTFSLSISSYLAVDWEIKGEEAEFSLDLRISFQHKETKAIKEFTVRLLTVKSKKEVEDKIGAVGIEIHLDGMKNFAQEEPRLTLRQMIDELESGEYVVNIDLRRTFTKKYNSWHEEIKID